MFKFLVSLALIALFAVGAYAGPDEDAIRKLLASSFDNPKERLVVEPVVVTGNHAIAGWSQGATGGLALLRQKDGAWALILCSGDGIKSANALKQAGISASDAAILSQQLAEAERQIVPERLALFSKFEGTMMMDASSGQSQHPAMHAPAHVQMVQANTPKEYRIGDILIKSPWSRATPKGAQVAGGYMSVTNTGNQVDRLISGSMDQARRFEVHEMTMVENVMRMRPLPNGIEIKPGETIELKPGGYHVMFMDLQEQLQQGKSIKGQLRFERAGNIDVEYTVEGVGAQGVSPHAH